MACVSITAADHVYIISTEVLVTAANEEEGGDGLRKSHRHIQTEHFAVAMATWFLYLRAWYKGAVLKKNKQIRDSGPVVPLTKHNNDFFN